jgi:hypothetical protein
VKLAVHLILLFVGILCSAGCGRWEREERAVVERQAAKRLHKMLWLHEAHFPERPRTNFAAIFQELGVEYPADLHERFRQYGRDAGFTNSIFERYEFVAKAISNEVLKGQIVVLGKEPYANESDKLVRLAITRSGPGYEGWYFDEVEEDWLQKLFRAAEAEMPRPGLVTSAPIPQKEFENRTPVTWRVRKFFENLAYYYGPGRFFWLPMMLICVGAVLFVVILLVVWFARRSRPKEE